MTAMLVGFGLTLRALVIQGVAVTLGVEAIDALMGKRVVGIHLWRNPEAPDRRRRNILILGVDPGENIFRHPQLDADMLARLAQPNTVLVDRRSRPAFFGERIIQGGGPEDDDTDLALVPVHVVGRFELGFPAAFPLL